MRIIDNGLSFVCFLTHGNAVESVYASPFREQLGLALEVAWLPVFRQVVFGLKERGNLILMKFLLK
jgi:hypothetical protein